MLETLQKYFSGSYFPVDIFATLNHLSVQSFASTLEKIKDEIRKCRVLCANCHAEHTQVQREEGIFAFFALKYSPKDFAWASFLELDETPSSRISWI